MESHPLLKELATVLVATEEDCNANRLSPTILLHFLQNRAEEVGGRLSMSIRVEHEVFSLISGQRHVHFRLVTPGTEEWNVSTPDSQATLRPVTGQAAE